MAISFLLQAEDGIRDVAVTGVQTCALPISGFVDVPSLKGIHYAMQSGIYAARAMFASLKAGDGTQLAQYDRLVDDSFIMRDLYRTRSEEHTSELQSRLHLVCRLLLEKKKTISVRLAAVR